MYNILVKFINVNNRRKIFFGALVLSAVLLIVLLPSLYISFNPILNAMIAVAIFLFISALFLIISYSLAGLVSFLMILLNTVLAFAFLQVLEVDFSWYVYISLILGLGISVDGAIVSFEKIKSNMMKGEDFNKSYNSVLKGSPLSLFDSYLMALLITMTMFFMGQSAVSDISIGMIVTVSIAIVTMVILNKVMIYLLFRSEMVKNMAVLFWYKGKVDSKLNKSFSKVDYIKWSKIFLLVSAVFIVLGIFASLVMIGLESDGVTSFTTNTDASFTGALAGRLAIGMAISLFLIFVYVTIRISWTFAIAASLALLHDVLFVLILFIVTRMHLSEIVIGALLLILGYSINDTLVIFDKIKEKFMTHTGEFDKHTLKKIISSSIAETMRRSIFTSAILFIAIIIPLFFDSAIWFNVATLLGILVGSFSSIFIAPLIWSKLELYRVKRVKERIKNNYWELLDKEEQVVNGINDYSP